jgi:lysophospholipid acyltransferase (LPLAT)-like uncharacterized protein
MTTIVINENTTKGKLIIDLIKEMGVGKIIDNSNKTPNKTTINAVEDAKAGYTTKCKDFDDYLNKVK